MKIAAPGCAVGPFFCCVTEKALLFRSCAKERPTTFVVGLLL
jgi:hypothetical protein